MTQKQFEKLISEASNLESKKEQETFERGANWMYKHQWVRTEDELPKDGQVVFICLINKVEDKVAYISVNVATYKDGVFHSYNDEIPTLWMEIPPGDCYLTK